MILKPTFIVTCLVRGSLNASAQGRPSPVDRVSVTRSDRNECYRHAAYIVVAKEDTTYAGSDLFVREVRSGRCDADSLSGDVARLQVWRRLRRRFPLATPEIIEVLIEEVVTP